MEDEADQQVDKQPTPTPLLYATPEKRRRGLGIASLLCVLVTPLVYVLLIVLKFTSMHPGWRVAVDLGMVAFVSAIAGLILSVLSFRREDANGYAVAGLSLSLAALFFNCFALSGAT